jgi:purine-binding chemotaxis protein CheW
MNGESKPRGAINWRKVRRRLDAARAATEQAWIPDADETTRILKARAQALAREPGEARDAEALEIVEFMLAHERYGVETPFVSEIHPLTNLTPLPCTPAFVPGIVNLRGEIVSVIDLKKFFDLPEKGLTDLNRVIVLQSDAMRFSVLADVVLGVRRVPVAEIQAALPTLTGIREQYLKGVTSERTIILDAAKLLADGKIVVQEQVQG